MVKGDFFRVFLEDVMIRLNLYLFSHGCVHYSALLSARFMASRLESIVSASIWVGSYVSFYYVSCDGDFLARSPPNVL